MVDGYRKFPPGMPRLSQRRWPALLCWQHGRTGCRTPRAWWKIFWCCTRLHRKIPAGYYSAETAETNRNSCFCASRFAKLEPARGRTSTSGLEDLPLKRCSEARPTEVRQYGLTRAFNTVFPNDMQYFSQSSTMMDSGASRLRRSARRYAGAIAFNRHCQTASHSSPDAA